MPRTVMYVKGKNYSLGSGLLTGFPFGSFRPESTSTLRGVSIPSLTVRSSSLLYCRRRGLYRNRQGLLPMVQLQCDRDIHAGDQEVQPPSGRSH